MAFAKCHIKESCVLRVKCESLVNGDHGTTVILLVIVGTKCEEIGFSVGFGTVDKFTPIYYYLDTAVWR